MGTEVETLMTAFLFSAVIMDGFDSTLTLFSLASALSAARNLSAAKAKALNPGGPMPPRGMRAAIGPPGKQRPDGEETRGEAAGADRPVDAELGVVGQRDLGGEHLDQHLARHLVELLDRLLDLLPEPRVGGDDDRVGDLVGDEPDLGHGRPALAAETPGKPPIGSRPPGPGADRIGDGATTAATGRSGAPGAVLVGVPYGLEMLDVPQRRLDAGDGGAPIAAAVDGVERRGEVLAPWCSRRSR